MKRLLSVILLATMVCGGIVSVNASEIIPYYEGVSSGAAMLSISKAGIALCTTTFTLWSTLVEADVEMKLMRFDSFGWTEVKTWNEHFGPSTQGAIAMSKRYAVPQNGIYRVVAIADIETNDGTDHLEPYSISVEYP